MVVAKDSDGQSYYKHAFNTQACEQLNAWLGGYESLLQRMTIDNFNWFIHTMLIYHTQSILHKQAYKIEKGQGQEEEEEEDDDMPY